MSSNESDDVQGLICLPSADVSNLVPQLWHTESNENSSWDFSPAGNHREGWHSKQWPDESAQLCHHEWILLLGSIMAICEHGERVTVTRHLLAWGNKSWFQSPRCPSIPLCLQASLVSPSASKCLFNMVRQLRHDTEIFWALWIHSFLLRCNARHYQMTVRTKMMFKALFCHSTFTRTAPKGPGWLSEKLGSWCGWRCHFGFKQWKAAAVNSGPS